MRIDVFGTPGCVICDSVYKLLHRASEVGKLKGPVVMKMLWPDGKTSSAQCETNLAEIAQLGILEPPAVALFDDNDEFIFGVGKLKSVKQIEVSKLENIQKRHSADADDSSQEDKTTAPGTS